MAEQGGLFWLALPSTAVPRVRSLLPRLGYTDSVTELVEPDRSRGQQVRWKGRDYGIEVLYSEDPAQARAEAPDRRPFLVRTAAGDREIVGYRGDGGALSRRGLPVYDARVLVNIAAPCGAETVADPFAGIGGIIREAIAPGRTGLSIDNDGWLALGLAAVSAGRHLLADAQALPFRAGSVGAVATEPPFDPEADPVVAAALPEIARVLRSGGRVSMLCAQRQAEFVRAAAARADLVEQHAAEIDRKGTPCSLFLWRKP
jgi:hypothetical protein